MTVEAVRECKVYGCAAGKHRVHEARAIPWPGETVYHRTVIASVYLASADTDEDDRALLLLLAMDHQRAKDNPDRYNYEVAELDLRPHGNLSILSDHLNIVPAVEEYEQNGGDY